MNRQSQLAALTNSVERHWPAPCDERIVAANGLAAHSAALAPRSRVGRCRYRTLVLRCSLGVLLAFATGCSGTKPDGGKTKWRTIDNTGSKT
jgi:hypothetical protein